MPKIPQLTNRGAAGLLTKLPTAAAKLRETIKKVEIDRSEINKIAPDLKDLIVPIKSLVPDPDNARLHPERNMEAIKDSLALYGQTTAIVARKSNRVVMAGNGRLQGAKDLGWTEIAVSFVDMDDAMAAGYGLADNRTAELAAWDMEVVHRLDKLYAEHDGYGAVGWNLDELTVLRTDWESFTGLLPTEEDGEEIERAPGDAELLMKLKVTIGEPETQVEDGQVYTLGRHTLAVVDVVHDVRRWMSLLKETCIFAPYPGPLVPQTLIAADPEKTLLLVQPNCYIAGQMLDQYKAAYGEESVTLESTI